MTNASTRATEAVLRGVLVIGAVITGLALILSAIFAHLGASAPLSPLIAAAIVSAVAVSTVLAHHSLSMDQ